MYAAKIIVLFALIGVCLSRPDGDHYSDHSHEEPAKYEFNYAVKDDDSGNDFGHQESRDGDDTQGSYYVLLPDTRRQTVTYYVNGDSGYVADVSYEGEAIFPDPKPKESYGN